MPEAPSRMSKMSRAFSVFATGGAMRAFVFALVAAVALAGLFAVSRVNYLLFHTLVELGAGHPHDSRRHCLDHAL